MIKFIKKLFAPGEFPKMKPSDYRPAPPMPEISKKSIIKRRRYEGMLLQKDKIVYNQIDKMIERLRRQ